MQFTDTKILYWQYKNSLQQPVFFLPKNLNFSHLTVTHVVQLNLFTTVTFRQTLLAVIEKWLL